MRLECGINAPLLMAIETKRVGSVGQLYYRFTGVGELVYSTLGQTLFKEIGSR